MTGPRKNRTQVRRRVMCSSIGGVIAPETAWRLRIIARELGLTLDKAALYCVNQFATQHGIDLSEIPDKEPDWILSQPRADPPARDHRSELDV